MILQFDLAQLQTLEQVDRFVQGRQQDREQGAQPRKLPRRAVEVFGDRRFERLARLSNGHLYNLRKRQLYRQRRVSYRKTRPRKVAIGERRRPRPEGRPGFVRVDTIH